MEKYSYYTHVFKRIPAIHFTSKNAPSLAACDIITFYLLLFTKM